jgi:hypothetical protein
VKSWLSTSVIVVAIIAIVVVVGTVVAVATIDVSPTGLTVNSHRTSEQTLDSELKGFAGASYFQQAFQQNGLQFKTTPGALDSVAGAQWLALRIENRLAQQALAKRGAEVTQSDLDASRAALQKGGVLAGMNSDASDVLVQLQASVTKLSKVAGSTNAALADLRQQARKASVAMTPRYGTWNSKRLAVCPPTNCRQAVPVVPSTQ